MALSHDLMRERSLSLIAEVREHLLHLTRDAPDEATFFRRQLAGLIHDGQGMAAPDAANEAALRRIQLYALRSWEEERSRLGERLRLGTAQLLANAAVELAASLPLLATDPNIVEQGLRSLEQELRAGLEALREILSGLESPQLMKELGLIGALEVYAQRLARQHAIQVITQFAARPPRLPPTIETGRGSPVGVEFYDHPAFGDKYRGAIFIADWSIGVIYAIHLERDGASYKAKAEKFCTGAPMNVTDLAVAPGKFVP